MPMVKKGGSSHEEPVVVEAAQTVLMHGSCGTGEAREDAGPRGLVPLQLAQPPTKGEKATILSMITQLRSTVRRGRLGGGARCVPRKLEWQ